MAATDPAAQSRSPGDKIWPLDLVLGARTAQLPGNLSCLGVDLPPAALARLDRVSHVPRGFPHDFLAAADYTLGGMSDWLDLPSGRTRYG